MHTKIIVGTVTVIILIGAGWLMFQELGSVRMEAPVAYEWIFTDMGVGEFGISKMNVSLKKGDMMYPIGMFDGSCAEQDTDLFANQKEKVVCWWAGGGKEIGVFMQDGNDVVMVGDVDEGDAETGGFRGNFQTVMEL